MRRSYSVIAAILLLAGCNTYHQGTIQKLIVRTPGIENAYCKLTTPHNRYDVMTPRPVIVERTEQPLMVLCEKTGYTPTAVIVKPHIHADGTVLNVTNGIVPGMIWDYASNSVFEYPDPIIVVMHLAPQAAPDVEQAPMALPKKEEPVKPVPLATAPQDKAAAEKSMSKSLRK
jgi:hypothetical protein